MEFRFYAAFVSLFAGMFMLFEGVSPMPRSLLDWSMTALGGALVLGYPLLLGKRFERWIKKASSWVLCPVLLAIGLVIIYQTLTKPFDLTSELIFALFGAGLFLISLIVLVKSKLGVRK